VRRRSRKSSAAEREAAVAALAGREVLLEAKAHCKVASTFQLTLTLTLPVTLTLTLTLIGARPGPTTSVRLGVGWGS